MAFDQSTRTRLQRFVSEARTLLTAECTRQLQHEYGMNPATGEVVELSRLPPLDDTRWETARLLRDTLAHYLATSPSGGRTEALQRLVREQAFTVLNRLVALRMMEARGLLLESIARGYQSRGFQLYQRLAGASLGETGDAYRCYLISLFDEFALDLAVLFDRFSPQGRLFPREAALLALLNLLNHPDIEALWAEDETIGWIYQYYNTQEERRQMRADSPAPRNSRELAVRNQFFTPRYVVEFLTDNTLGRLWYEMTQGRTALTDQCRYLVRRPQEIFLQSGEEPPAQAEPQKELSQEELLQQPVYIPFRALKDPRDIRMLDPACGSMHFGLYAFDLFEVIYDEAWEIAHSSDEAQKSSASFVSCVFFVVQYPDKATFLADVPRLIIEHNLHGIDIDPRAVQIAGLSLWLRAQRTWQQQGLRPQDRPGIRRSNIVCAEPMPGEEAFLDEFIEAHLSATPEHKLLGQLVRRVFDAMKLAGEAGSLLKIEEGIAGAVAEAKQKWLAGPTPEQGLLFADDTAPPAQKGLGLDVAGITDKTFWEKAEERIYAALQTYAEQAEHGGGYQRLLFADDAARGFGFIDLCRKRYDAVLMNPPFGAPTAATTSFLASSYPRIKTDLYGAFVENGLNRLAALGYLGAITSRTGFFSSSFKKWREEVLLNQATLSVLADFGGGVLDTAMVETAAYSLCKQHATRSNSSLFIRLSAHNNKSDTLLSSISEINKSEIGDRVFLRAVSDFGQIPNSPFCYWIPEHVIHTVLSQPPFEPNVGAVLVGVQTDNDPRFVRFWAEVSPLESGCSLIDTFHGRGWVTYLKGDSTSPFFLDHELVLNWFHDGRELRAATEDAPGGRVNNEESYYKAGISWAKRTDYFTPHIVPRGCIPSISRYLALVSNRALHIYAAMGVLSSKFCDFLAKLRLEKVKQPCFIPGVIRSVPFPALSLDAAKQMELIVAEAVKNVIGFSKFEEGSRLFVAALANTNFDELSSATENHSEMLESKLLQLTSLSQQICIETNKAYQVPEQDDDWMDFFYDDDTDTANVLTPVDVLRKRFRVDYPELTTRFISWAIGLVLGRWDIWFATGEKPAPALLDPFAPLPVCPPGQLQNEQGLPITQEDVTRLKEEDCWNYPIEIPWDGILVDDPGHPLDLEARVHHVLQIIWQDRWEAIEREACEILGVRTLRDYFRKPADFFADHLKRYSKSRRKAPIYWPLQTPSGSYTLWLYYHRLNDQTLYTCVNDFVEKSKLREVTEQLNVLRTKTDRSKEEEKKLDHLLDFEQELKDFRDELLRVAKFWKPNLNDGVQITAAPLWKLFQHRPWQNTLKDTWEKLEKGDYDWAHLAYSIWPDRVRDKCRHDKSLAIAHGLEELYETPPEQPKKKRGRARG